MVQSENEAHLQSQATNLHKQLEFLVLSIWHVRLLSSSGTFLRTLSTQQGSERENGFGSWALAVASSATALCGKPAGMWSNLTLAGTDPCEWGEDLALDKITRQRQFSFSTFSFLSLFIGHGFTCKVIWFTSKNAAVYVWSMFVRPKGAGQDREKKKAVCRSINQGQSWRGVMHFCHVMDTIGMSTWPPNQIPVCITTSGVTNTVRTFFAIQAVRFKVFKPYRFRWTNGKLVTVNRSCRLSAVVANCQGLQWHTEGQRIYFNNYTSSWVSHSWLEILLHTLPFIY